MPAFNSSTFADFLSGTRETYLADGKVINLTGYNTLLLDKFLKGKADEEIIQGGDKIMVNLNVSNPENGGSINPGDTVQRRNHNGLATLETGWRFDFDAWTYTKQEVELNKQEQVVNIAQQKRKQFRQGLHERFEKKLWRTPNAAEMEGVGAREPYSIPCFITDDGNLPGGFSTLMGYTWPLGGNKVETYTSADATNTLLKAFRRMYRKLSWDSAGVQSEWTDGTKWNKCFIPTNSAGMDQWDDVITDGQGGNIFVAQNSSDMGVVTQKHMFNGVPLIWASYLDDLSWATPKYYWINSEYMHPVYHQSVYMQESDPKEFQDQPNVFYVDNNTWHNFVAKARHRHGIVVAG